MAKMGHKQAKKIRQGLQKQLHLNYRSVKKAYKAMKRAIRTGEQTL